MEDVEGPEEASLRMYTYLMEEQLETLHLIKRLVIDTGRCKE